MGCVRLFFRTLALRADGSASASVCGWGEVCSEPELRGRGIVGLVLREALARVRAAAAGAPPCALALLHAAAGVASMYEKFGFAACLPIPYGQLAVGRCLAPAPAPAAAAAAAAALPGHPRARLRAVDFDADWQALEALRAAQAGRLGLVGWTLRSEAYWRRWVRYACRGAACVLEVQQQQQQQQQQQEGAESGGSSGGYAIVAYGYARWREGAWRAMDWASVGGAAAAALGSGGAGQPPLLAAFAAALLAAGHAFQAAAGDAGPVAPLDASLLLPCGSLALALPLALLRDVCSGSGGGGAAAAAVEAPALADRGWMALDLAPPGGEGGGALAALAAAAAQGSFLIFPADNF